MPMLCGCVLRVSDFVRPELLGLPQYAAQRARTGILLDANESPYGESGLNRYPDPDYAVLHTAMAAYYGVPDSCVLATRGSDDGIDALGRAFLTPGRDAVMVTPPTFAMFAVFARLQGAAVVEVPLTPQFEFDARAMTASWFDGVKLVYVCSPNNPTGSVMPLGELQTLCAALAGKALVVVDEAYQEFSTQPSAVTLLASVPNLVVLRTLSKAFGLAGIRCGVLLASADIVQWVRRVLPPYLLPTPVVDIAVNALSSASVELMRERCKDITARRDAFARAAEGFAGVVEVLNGHANSVLLRFRDAQATQQRLRDAGIHVRAFDGRLADWLRFSIGTEEEMSRAQAALR